jgi:WD40 repeat protein/GTPase SAR1 family protein
VDESFEYDVFISHSSKDKLAVRELAERLVGDGLRVWLDEWVIQPGDLISLKIEEGLERSRALVLAMSAHAFASEWVRLERHTALFRDPTNRQRRFIPLRLDDAEIKDTLKQFAYVDWRRGDEREYAKLLAACRAADRPRRAAGRVSDLTAREVLRGHGDNVQCVAVTADGGRIVSGSVDKTVRVWDAATGECVAVLGGHRDRVSGVAVTPDGRHAVSGANDRTVRVWEMESGECVAVLNGHTHAVREVRVTPDSRHAVSGASDNTVRVWDWKSRECAAVLKGHLKAVWALAVTPDGERIISGSSDTTVRVWERASGQCVAVLKGHTNGVLGVAVTPDGSRIISCSSDKTIKVWEAQSGRCVATLEGHNWAVWEVAVTPDGERLVSCSADKTVRVWELASGKCLAAFEGHERGVLGVAVMPDGQRAVSASDDWTLRVWALPAAAGDLADEDEEEAARYTNAKVLLVGEAGVGKSGLAMRLIEDRFEPTISTDGAWATQMKLSHSAGNGGGAGGAGDDIEREIWLWDFAGQADYRLIHQLFMDETALAVLVFNPQSENPFEGLGQWDRDLQRAARRSFRKLLVAGRCDRGGLMVSRESVERFREERGFARYLETSAYTSEGCRELKKAIISQIPWDDIPWTASPRIFKLLKEEILRLKDGGRVLLRMAELKQQLEMRLPAERFSLDELRAVVGLLVGPGVVWQLEFGDFVLLQPERVNAYAAAVIRRVRAHTEEIGCIREEDVLAGRLDFQDMQRLPRDEEQIVLRAMHQTFIERGLCLREHTEFGTLLVFPSYFRRERPDLGGHPAAFVTYRFSGMLEEIYATLVVRLHHTTTFDKDQLWRFAADFRTQAGRRVGLKLTKLQEGAAEITIYFEAGIPDDTKVTFIRYVHDHLRAKDEGVVRVRHYVCPHCQMPVENRRAVGERLRRGLRDVVCVNCEQRVLLLDLIEEKFASDELQSRVRELEQRARTRIDNESRELILVGHAFSIAGEAGQIFRPTPNSDWGVDGEIEFKDDDGNASGARVYLQLKSGDSYLETRKDGRQIFKIRKPRHAAYWQAHAYPVMLVVRAAGGEIRWMNVTEYLKRHGAKTRQVVFEGEPFTALSLVRLRDKVFGQAGA